MKSIKLSTTDKDLLKVVCEQAPQGISIDEVRRSIRILDKLDAAGDVVALEDADHQYLLARFSDMKFIRADRSVLDLFDRVKDAPEQLTTT